MYGYAFMLTHMYFCILMHEHLQLHMFISSYSLHFAFNLHLKDCLQVRVSLHIHRSTCIITCTFPFTYAPIHIRILVFVQMYMHIRARML